MGKMDYTTFEPVTKNGITEQFKFMARTNVFNSANSDDGEIKRLEWLQLWLSDNKICPNGYVIVSRNAIELGYSDAVKNIYYVGKCK